MSDRPEGQPNTTKKETIRGGSAHDPKYPQDAIIHPRQAVCIARQLCRFGARTGDCTEHHKGWRAYLHPEQNTYPNKATTLTFDNLVSEAADLSYYP